MFGDFTVSHIVQSFIVFYFLLLKHFFFHAAYLCINFFSIFSYYQSFAITTAFDLAVTFLHLICVSVLDYLPYIDASSIVFPSSLPQSHIAIFLFIIILFNHGWVALKCCRNTLSLGYLGVGGEVTANIYSDEYVSGSMWGQMVVSDH